MVGQTVLTAWAERWLKRWDGSRARTREGRRRTGNLTNAKYRKIDNMPITQIPYPILSQFGCAVTKTTGMPPQPLDATPAQKAQVDEEDRTPKQLPKGVVLGPDGKPYVKQHLTL